VKVTIEKKTDQLNYEDFLGGLTRIVTIAGVTAGTKEQQYDIAIEDDRRVWRPSVTVLKQLVDAWGDDAKEWAGHRAELYGDPDVTFGRDKVGGIRIARLSHIDGPRTAKLTITRGKRGDFTVQPITAQEMRRLDLAAEWRTADADRRAAIEAEVATLQGQA
jgi:hypothetical protein